MDLKFRKLEAHEIECRIATVKRSGVTLLLYKDARCDMNILDETVGASNWQRHHTRENANCTVSIWDAEKTQWIEKEDTGTESFTEKEKGLASDSFKRSCFNWGIGRELYTAPFLWIGAENCKIEETNRKDNYGNAVYTCRDRFYVSDITYDDKNRIVSIVIKNPKTHKVVFPDKKKECGYEGSDSTRLENMASGIISDVQLRALKSMLSKTGTDEKAFCAMFKVESIETLSRKQYKTAMDSLGAE